MEKNAEPVEENHSEITATLVIFISTLVIVKVLITRKQSIPGPWGLPIVGHLPFIGSNPIKKFADYRKKYGDIFFLRFGPWPTVVINGRAMIKHILYNKSDSFAARPDFFSFKVTTNMEGLSACGFDQRYLMHRKIASSVMKELSGVNNARLQELITDETDILLSDFQLHNENPFDPHDALTMTAGSIIYQFCYGRGENVREDPSFLHVIDNSKKFREFMKAGNPFDLFPWLRFVMPGKFRDFMNLISTFQVARKQKTDEISKTFDPKHIRHAVDGLFLSVDKYGLSDTPNDVGLTKEQVLETVTDFFGAGFDTTAMTLKWAFLYMAAYPEIQHEVQEELTNNVGETRMPTIKDRENLPFTEATILEIMRISVVAPLGVPHSAAENVSVNGHMIEKGTVVFFNMFSLMHDEEWGNPTEFQPERYFDQSGNLMKEKVENVLPFSAGRRRCLGEALARTEVFVIFASVLHKFTIVKPDGVNYDFEGEFSLTYSPKPFNICVKLR